MAMTKPCAAAPICCFPSARLPGRTCSPVRCSPNSFTAQPRSLRTTPIIAKVEAMRAAGVAATLACVALIGAGGPAERMAEAQREAARHAARIGQIEDRKRVLKGKSWSVRVDLGGRRNLKKKKT